VEKKGFAQGAFRFQGSPSAASAARGGLLNDMASRKSGMHETKRRALRWKAILKLGISLRLANRARKQRLPADGVLGCRDGRERR